MGLQWPVSESQACMIHFFGYGRKILFIWRQDNTPRSALQQRWSRAIEKALPSQEVRVLGNLGAKLFTDKGAGGLSIQNSSLLCIINFTTFIKTALCSEKMICPEPSRIWNEGRDGRLVSTKIFILYTLEELKLHMLKRKFDGTIIFEQNTANWRSWRSRSWIQERSGNCCWKEGESKKSLDDWWWKQRMGQRQWQKQDPFGWIPTYPNLSLDFLLRKCMSRGCFAKIIVPITDVIALISCFEILLNDISITVEYKSLNS